MNKILKFIFPKLFLSENERNKIIKDLETNPNFRTKDQLQDNKNSLNEAKFKLKKGEISSVFLPDFGNQNGFKITKWHFKIGDVIKSGDVICDLENERLAMEFESIHIGRLIAICESKNVITSGMEICKIEGI